MLPKKRPRPKIRRPKAHPTDTLRLRFSECPPRGPSLVLTPRRRPPSRRASACFRKTAARSITFFRMSAAWSISCFDAPSPSALSPRLRVFRKPADRSFTIFRMSALRSFSYFDAPPPSALSPRPRVFSKDRCPVLRLTEAPPPVFPLYLLYNFTVNRAE